MTEEQTTSATVNLPVRESEEFRLTGRPIAAGLGMGAAYILGDVFSCPGRAFRIEPNDAGKEVNRIQEAFQKTRVELEVGARRVQEQFTPELADIFRAHQMMLENLLSSQEFEREVQGALVNAEAAVRRVFYRWQEKFRSLPGETFHQRADDIADIGRKVLRNLHAEGICPLENLPPSSVLVCERLLPSDVVSLPRKAVSAIVVEWLGFASHAALLAREKSIPTTADYPELMEQVQDGDMVLVDGYRGEVIINPKPATLLEFQAQLQKHEATQVRCQGACRKPAYTLDGQKVTIEANIGVVEDVFLAADNGADGIGLFRMEQLYLSRDFPPSEAELLRELRTVTAPLRDKPITIRLLDAGGDKPVPFLRFPSQANPLLGKRGVRVLLEYSQLARTQLTALLHLAQEQPIQILVPMVTLEEDVQVIRELYTTVCTELRAQHPPMLGAMIETPSAALNVPAISRHVDFLSVGTNDLTQYTLAAGRDDPAVNRYYQDTHASVLRLLRIIVADAGSTPLALCGELAGREEMIPQLLAMGFRAFSMAPPLIPGTKELVRSLRVEPTAAPRAT